MKKSKQFLHFLALSKSQIGISKEKLCLHLNCNLGELEHFFELARYHKIKFRKLVDEEQEFWLLESAYYWNRIPFSNQEILELIRPQIWDELPQTLKEKLNSFVSDPVFNSIQSNYPKQVNWNQNFDLRSSYELSYFSRKTNRYEKRLISPKKLLRIGSQQIIEAYCFKRKSFRWFEIGRIKHYKQVAYKIIPEKPRYYFKELVLKFDKSLLEHVKWLFHDILLAYSNTTVRIRYSEIENIKKEIACSNQIEIVN